MEKNGFFVEYIELIPRPTPIDDISNWLDIFANGITENLTEKEKKEFKTEVKEILKPKLYTSQNGWVADYVRLRLKAVKIK